jgi:hypothetical protein
MQEMVIYGVSSNGSTSGAQACRYSQTPPGRSVTGVERVDETFLLAAEDDSPRSPVCIKAVATIGRRGRLAQLVRAPL